MKNTTNKILESIENNNYFTEIMPIKHRDKENELLFFFKPGLFLIKNKNTQEQIVNLALEKIKQFDIEICSITQVSGPALKEHEIMDRHYGFINTMSKNASKILTIEEKHEMCEMMNIEYNEGLKFYGGHEYLEENPTFDANSLDEFWLQKKSIRLRSGLYFNQYNLNGDNFILINAFHPQQLCKFTDDDRNIVIMLLNSDKNWAELKNDLVGDTYPEKAEPHSIRGEIFAKREDFNLGEVTISNNFCHLSAGPFEAFLEMNNFYSNIIKDFDLPNTNIFKQLMAKGLEKDKILETLKNPIANEEHLFDITENSNTSEAIETYISKYN